MLRVLSHSLLLLIVAAQLNQGCSSVNRVLASANPPYAEEDLDSVDRNIQNSYSIHPKIVHVRDLLRNPKSKPGAPKHRVSGLALEKLFGSVFVKADETAEITPARFVHVFMNCYVFNSEKTALEIDAKPISSFEMKTLKSLSMGEVKNIYEHLEIDKTPKYATFFKKVEITVTSDKKIKKTYLAVLEFDSDSKLIGGEWLSQKQPKQLVFLTFPKNGNHVN